MRWWLLTLLLLVSCEKQAPVEAQRPVKILEVSEASSAGNETVFPGSLRAFRRADLSFRVDGTVIMRDVAVGDKIKKEEILIQLDPREYEIALKKAQGKVDSMMAQLDFAGRDYERMKRIFEKDPGAISESLLDRKKETNNQLKAELIIAESDLEKAQDDLAYTSLKAPFDGIIAAIYVENHEQVRAKQTVLRLLDIADREMEINVPEKYINALLEGKDKLKFDVRLDAFPNALFTASIKEIGTEASSTTQTYPVTLSLQNIPVELSLLAGMSGKAVMSSAKEQVSHTFKIPRSAIFSDGHASYVWIVDTHTQTIHKRAVTLDESSKGDHAVIQEGLTAGDKIVTAGTSFLQEGQKVTWYEEQPKP